MAGELTCYNILIKEDGTEVPFDDLTEEERADFAERAGQKMAEAFQDWFSRHPEEFRPPSATRYRAWRPSAAFRCSPAPKAASR